MSEKPISPLRQRMLEDMSLRGFTPDTQRDYIRAVKKLAAFLGRSPDTATPAGAAPLIFNQTKSNNQALRSRLGSRRPGLPRARCLRRGCDDPPRGPFKKRNE